MKSAALPLWAPGSYYILLIYCPTHKVCHKTTFSLSNKDQSVMGGGHERLGCYGSSVKIMDAYHEPWTTWY